MERAKTKSRHPHRHPCRHRHLGQHRHSGRHRRPGRLAAIVAALVLAAGVWGWAPPAAANDEATFVAVYNAAVAARKAAAKAGYEWRDTKKLLRQARKLAEKGKLEEAIALADRAKRQGELGLMQAEEQDAVWRAAVVK